MRKTQAILLGCVIILLAMIFYTYFSGKSLGWILKGWLIICVILYVIRLYEKYRIEK